MSQDQSAVKADRTGIAAAFRDHTMAGVGAEMISIVQKGAAGPYVLAQRRVAGGRSHVKIAIRLLGINLGARGIEQRLGAGIGRNFLAKLVPPSVIGKRGIGFLKKVRVTVCGKNRGGGDQ